ncbi:MULTISPECIES: hypothetical protein [Geobacillus]|uniref:hypothetical protein n=1 Tax=Geobacillus TaxID=129337 RepID=UPI0027DB7103|nr:hypothetical protein [Geobacillus kaustophilus]WMJ20820.1 hypothetical protein RA957_04630 [Geobacillus kaustophilus]
MKEQWNDDVHYCQGERAVSRSLRKTALALATASKTELIFCSFLPCLVFYGPANGRFSPAVWLFVSEVVKQRQRRGTLLRYNDFVVGEPFFDCGSEKSGERSRKIVKKGKW